MRDRTYETCVPAITDALLYSRNGVVLVLIGLAELLLSILFASKARGKASVTTFMTQIVPSLAFEHPKTKIVGV